jgi:conjugal transfer pilus assembly protein TraB
MTKSNQQLRKRQWLLLAGVGVAIIAAALGVAIATNDGGKAKAVQIAARPKTTPLSVGVTEGEREAAKAGAASDLEAMKKLISEDRAAEEQSKKQMKEEIDALKKVVEEQQKQKSGTAGTQSTPPPTNGFGGGTPFNQIGGNPPPPIRPTASATGLGVSPNGTVASGRQSAIVSIPNSASAAGAPSDNSVANRASDQVNGGARNFGEREQARRDNPSSPQFNRTADDAPLSPNRAGGRSAETFIPPGTYMRAIILNGLDAPTGGQSQQNPHPVLLKVIEDAQLPNSYRANLKNCMVTANGFGAIEAERAYIRTDRLSCIDDNGGAIDVALKGYVAGEDGKTGVRGRVVEKTGRILANSIYAAIGSGIGQALKAEGTTQTTNALGGVTEQTTDGFKAGFGTGLSKAFDRISEYYLKVAEKLFPVIEVQGGRTVDIVISQGVSIERANTTK